MARRKSRNKGRHRPKSNKRIWVLSLLAGVSLAALSGGGLIAYNDMQIVNPDDQGCYPASDRTQTTVLVDSSDPGFDTVQSRDLINGIGAEFKKVRFNDQFEIITTQASRIGSIPEPVVSLCGSARSQNDLKSVGARKATLEFIHREAEQAFEKALMPVMRKVFSSNPADGDRQRNESPILEQIQSISRMSNFDGARQKHLVLVSDLLQNTEDRQFCVTKGHLPSFAKFKKSDYFSRIQPSNLNGMDVTVYMPIRGQLGKKPFPYCSENELRKFWREYFVDAGARNVEFVRIRRGYATKQ